LSKKCEKERRFAEILILCGIKNYIDVNGFTAVKSHEKGTMIDSVAEIVFLIRRSLSGLIPRGLPRL